MEALTEKLSLVGARELLVIAIGAPIVITLGTVLPLAAAWAPRTLVTSLTSLGFWIALSTPIGATPRSTDHPLRSSDAPAAPWSPAEGPPPLPSAGVKESPSTDMSGKAEVATPPVARGKSDPAPLAPTISATPPHPAIHGGGAKPSGPLFPRVGQPLSDCTVDPELARCMKRHPAGRGLGKKAAGSTTELVSPSTTETRSKNGQAPDWKHSGKRGNSEAAPAIERSYVVQRGDSLWAIAEDLLGTDNPAKVARYWPAIHRANRETIGRDPNFLLPGQVLQLPDPAQF